MRSRSVILMLLAFILFRVLYLDRDLPPGDLTKFGQKDEQSYNFTALNMYHFGALSKKIDDQHSVRGSIWMILNNVFTFASLSALGNNYFGLRAGAVLASVLVFLLFMRLLIRDCAFTSAGEKRRWLLLLGLFLAFDFSFLVASRNSAPAIFRSLYLMLTITYTAHFIRKPDRRQWPHLLLLGCACSFLIFFSYLTNAFILAGAMLFFLLKGIRERGMKRATVSLLFLSTGAVIGAFISNRIYISFIGSGMVESISTSFNIYGNRVFGVMEGAAGVKFFLGLLLGGLRKLRMLVTANLFALNLSLLFFIVLTCAGTLRSLFRKKTVGDLQLLSVSFILAYILQAFFYNPDSSKWISMMAPVLLLAVASSPIRPDRAQGGDARRERVAMGGLLAFAFVCGVGVLGFLGPGRSREFAVLILMSFAFLLGILWAIRRKVRWAPTARITVVLALAILPNAFLSVKYCILRPEFHYRDACVALDKIIGDRYMAGAWSDGFRLYTRGKVLLPWYQVQDKEKHRRRLTDIFERKLADYTVDFPGDDFFEPERDINGIATSFRLRRIASIYLGKGALGRSIWVYKRFENNDDGGRQP